MERTDLASASFRLQRHPHHRRLRALTLSASAWERFLQSVQDISVQELEYVPYQRLFLAHQLNEAGQGALQGALNQLLHDRESGGLELEAPEGLGKEELIKISTAVSHLVGIPNFDAMSGKYYACFVVEDTDHSDSYLRQAYRLFTLHTDGTYVDEATDWILMQKIQEQNAVGGESRLLHLDDWEELDAFANHPYGGTPIEYSSPPSKNVPTVLQRQTFYWRNGRPCLCFIDQFANPRTIEDALYLKEMSQSMENSPAVLSLPLPVGHLLLLNNHFWVHGRGPFAPHAELYRELLRQRGAFRG